MFTWNFQLISKARLSDTLNQLKLNVSNGDILIRIHTASHRPDEAVELAQFLTKLVPGVKVFGTSTSAIIINGRLMPNQCLISITQMNRGHIRTALLPVSEAGNVIEPKKLCKNVKQ